MPNTLGYYLKISLEWKTGCYTIMEIYVALGTTLILLLNCFKLNSFCNLRFCVSGFIPYIAIITLTFYVLTQIVILWDIYGIWKKTKV